VLLATRTTCKSLSSAPGVELHKTNVHITCSIPIQRAQLVTAHGHQKRCLRTVDGALMRWGVTSLNERQLVEVKGTHKDLTTM
jgi:hypothetical protein